MPAAFEGEPLEIGFNPEFLKEGIESVEGDEVMLRVISPLRPGLLQPVDNEDFRYLVMPIRLNVEGRAGAGRRRRASTAAQPRPSCGSSSTTASSA